METKKVRPVLVESKESTLHLSHGKLLIRSIESTGKSDLYKSIPQELILISLENEKIEVGDICLNESNPNDVNNNLIKIDSETSKYNANNFSSCKKVIARQSQISPEYISKFIEQYNNGCVEDLEIEMMYKDCPNSSIENWNYFPEPLLTNGFVSIVEKEPISYTEEEVNKLLHKFLDIQEGLNTYQRHASLDTWFEQNKKK